MRKSFFIIYNGKMNTEAGVLVMKRPAIPASAKDYEEVEVEGRDGILYEDLGTWSDIQIPISFNFIENEDHWNQRFRKIRSWIFGTEDQRLIMSDDRDYFYKVKKVEIQTGERVMKRLGKFEAVFTCEAFQYVSSGRNRIELPEILVNQGYLAKPIYFIYGNGNIELTLNGNSVTANVEKSLTIDTSLGLTYISTGEMKNTALSGKYEDLYLQAGKNQFSFSDGFEIWIQPNWRYV